MGQRRSERELLEAARQLDERLDVALGGPLDEFGVIHGPFPFTSKVPGRAVCLYGKMS
jgi:hypothetical protein